MIFTYDNVGGLEGWAQWNGYFDFPLGFFPPGRGGGDIATARLTVFSMNKILLEIERGGGGGADITHLAPLHSLPPTRPTIHQSNIGALTLYEVGEKCFGYFLEIKNVALRDAMKTGGGIVDIPHMGN